MALAYNGTPPGDDKPAEHTGWLNLSLQQRPVFVTERDSALRPDVAPDSISADVQGETLVVEARVVNRGGCATPRSPSGPPYPTWAVLTANGDSLAQSPYTDTIGVNQRVNLQFAVGTQGLPDTMLLEVRVNPAQTYVELGTDDNAGYLRRQE